MSMEWYRAYHGMPHDPKLQVVAKRSGQKMSAVVAVWLCVLDAASQHDPRGIFNIDPEEISVIQDIELEDVEAIIKALKSKRMLDDEGLVVNWDKRQHTTSTERMRKLRDKKKRDVTAGDTKRRKNSKKAPDTDSDTDSDAEENTDTDKKQNKKRNRTRIEKRESEREKHKTCGKLQKQTPQILEQMLDIWNAEVQSKLTGNHNAILTPKRKEQMTIRWLEDFQQDMRAWQYFCEVIAASDFCLGKLEGKSWTIDLSWATKSSEHVAKILEGGFSGGKHPKQPPICNVPELVDSWNEVLQKLQQKYGKPSIRCWFGNTVITQVNSHHVGKIVTLQCPKKFIRDWIEKHFLTDINRFWAEQNQQIITTELTIKEN